MVSSPLSILHGIGSHFHGDFLNAKSFISSLLREVRGLAKTDARAGRILTVALVTAMGFFVLKVLCFKSNSLALTAFSELIMFDVFYLLVALASIWIGRQSPDHRTYCFGYNRFEVIAVFASTMPAILASFYLLKEAIECLFEPSEVRFSIETKHLKFPFSKTCDL